MAADLSHVRKLLKKHPSLEIVNDSKGRGKVKCKITGHELPCQLAAIDTYIRGKKYQRLNKDKQHVKKKDSSSQNMERFLVPSEKRRNQLYCKLTMKYLNDLPHHITVHCTGKRFKKALEQYDGTSDLAGEPGVKQTKSTNGGDAKDVWEPPDDESEEKEDYVPDLEGFEGSDVENGTEEEMEEEEGEMEEEGEEEEEEKAEDMEEEGDVAITEEEENKKETVKKPKKAPSKRKLKGETPGTAVTKKSKKSKTSDSTISEQKNIPKTKNKKSPSKRKNNKRPKS